MRTRAALALAACLLPAFDAYVLSLRPPAPGRVRARQQPSARRAGRLGATAAQSDRPTSADANLKRLPSGGVLGGVARVALAPVLLPVGFVATYARYLKALWRPEDGLPRKVHLERIARFASQLEELIANEERAGRLALSPAGSPNEKGAEEFERRPGPRDGATEQRVHALRLSCAAATEALNGDLEREAAAAAKAKAADQQAASAKASNAKDLAGRVVTGWTLAAGATAWIFSGNVCHALGLYLLSVVAQLEYYRSVIATGVYPARRIGILATTATFAAALLAPQVHELMLPLASIAVMVWLLLLRKAPSTISEISSSYMGIFYVGFLPSFWIRLRTTQDLGLSMVDPGLAKAGCCAAWAAAKGLPLDLVTQGAIVKWWVCLTIAFSDIGAYFGGKAAGKTPLSAVGRGAAGRTSPNKTVEGAVSGLLASALVSGVGACAMGWPGAPLSGALFGLALGVIAAIGDLTASMFKRDAGLKDFGMLFPGHGGVLDRFDSYIFTGPFVFFFVKHALPFLAAAAAAAGP